MLPLIEKIRDYSSFGIACTSSIMYFYDLPLHSISNIIATYLFIDLFINKKLDIYTDKRPLSFSRVNKNL